MRVQLNLKVDEAGHIAAVKHFRSIVFPIMWVEEVSAPLHTHKLDCPDTDV